MVQRQSGKQAACKSCERHCVLSPTRSKRECALADFSAENYRKCNKNCHPRGGCTNSQFSKPKRLNKNEHRQSRGMEEYRTRDGKRKRSCTIQNIVFEDHQSSESPPTSNPLLSSDEDIDDRAAADQKKQTIAPASPNVNKSKKNGSQSISDPGAERGNGASLHCESECFQQNKKRKKESSAGLVSSVSEKHSAQKVHSGCLYEELDLLIQRCPLFSNEFFNALSHEERGRWVGRRLLEKLSQCVNEIIRHGYLFASPASMTASSKRAKTKSIEHENNTIEDNVTTSSRTQCSCKFCKYSEGTVSEHHRRRSKLKKDKISGSLETHFAVLSDAIGTFISSLSENSISEIAQVAKSSANHHRTHKRGERRLSKDEKSLRYAKITQINDDNAILCHSKSRPRCSKAATSKTTVVLSESESKPARNSSVLSRRSQSSCSSHSEIVSRVPSKNDPLNVNPAPSGASVSCRKSLEALQTWGSPPVVENVVNAEDKHRSLGSLASARAIDDFVLSFTSAPSCSSSGRTETPTTLEILNESRSKTDSFPPESQNHVVTSATVPQTTNFFLSAAEVRTLFEDVQSENNNFGKKEEPSAIHLPVPVLEDFLAEIPDSPQLGSRAIGQINATLMQKTAPPGFKSMAPGTVEIQKVSVAESSGDDVVSGLSKSKLTASAAETLGSTTLAESAPLKSPMPMRMSPESSSIPSEKLCVLTAQSEPIGPLEFKSTLNPIVHQQQSFLDGQTHRATANKSIPDWLDSVTAPKGSDSKKLEGGANEFSNIINEGISRLIEFSEFSNLPVEQPLNLPQDCKGPQSSRQRKCCAAKTGVRISAADAARLRAAYPTIPSSSEKNSFICDTAAPTNPDAVSRSEGSDEGPSPGPLSMNSRNDVQNIGLADLDQFKNHLSLPSFNTTVTCHFGDTLPIPDVPKAYNVGGSLGTSPGAKVGVLTRADEPPVHRTAVLPNDKLSNRVFSNETSFESAIRPSVEPLGGQVLRESSADLIQNPEAIFDSEKSAFLGSSSPHAFPEKSEPIDPTMRFLFDSQRKTPTPGPPPPAIHPKVPKQRRSSTIVKTEKFVPNLKMEPGCQSSVGETHCVEQKSLINCKLHGTSVRKSSLGLPRGIPVTVKTPVLIAQAQCLQCSEALERFIRVAADVRATIVNFDFRTSEVRVILMCPKGHRFCVSETSHQRSCPVCSHSALSTSIGQTSSLESLPRSTAISEDKPKPISNIVADRRNKSKPMSNNANAAAKDVDLQRKLFKAAQERFYATMRAGLDSVPPSFTTNTRPAQKSTKTLTERAEAAARNDVQLFKSITFEQAVAVRRLLLVESCGNPWRVLALEPPVWWCGSRRKYSGGADSKRADSLQHKFHEAKEAFKKTARLVHPDKNQHPKAAEAFGMLDSAWKQIYDALKI